MEVLYPFVNSITEYQKMVVPDLVATTETKVLISELLTWFFKSASTRAIRHAKTLNQKTVELGDVQLAVQQMVGDELFKHVQSAAAIAGTSINTDGLCCSPEAATYIMLASQSVATYLLFHASKCTEYGKRRNISRGDVIHAIRGTTCLEQTFKGCSILQR